MISTNTYLTSILSNDTELNFSSELAITLSAMECSAMMATRLRHRIEQSKREIVGSCFDDHHPYNYL